MQNCLTKLLFLFLFGICSLFVQTSFAQNRTNNTLINDFISRQARISKGVEYKGARKIIYADLNKNGSKDAVVLYTLEGFYGRNNYIQYLAIFIKDKNDMLKNVKREIIGGKNNRDVYLESVVNEKINLKTMNYLPKDASCCPSREEHSQIIFSKNKLREVKIN